jgi:N-acetyl-gamma-glutamyl-phosphate reductase
MVIQNRVCSCAVAEVGIVGASGFAGAELLRLCALHPDLRVGVATGDTQAGTPAASLYPSLVVAYRHLAFTEYDASALAGLDLVFLALPHGASQPVVAELIDKVGNVVDLSADFRLKDPGAYERWYGAPHNQPELLAEAAYGLPELFRPDIREARLVAVPGCYPTAAALALAPLVREGVIDATGVIVDAASGVSGAGRGLKSETAFCTVDAGFTAYGLLDHRHTPEIEQATGTEVLFTPHLAPMSRGILATCYARPGRVTDTGAVLAILADAYAHEPFVAVSSVPPSTKATLGANTCHLTARVDERTHWVLVIAALDNLVKGAAGQAVQCANLLLGLPEETGLPVVGTFP